MANRKSTTSSSQGTMRPGDVIDTLESAFHKLEGTAALLYGPVIDALPHQRIPEMEAPTMFLYAATRHLQTDIEAMRAAILAVQVGLLGPDDAPGVVHLMTAQGSRNGGTA